MSPLRPIVVFVLLAGLCAGVEIGGSSAQPAPADSTPPMRVLSDTPEYCQYLSGEVVRAEARHAQVPADARTLAHEGRLMCDRGFVRGGIHRLRRALLLLRKGS